MHIFFGRLPSTQVLAGSTEPAFVDGDAADSRLNFPQSICQPDANTLLIADRCNGSVRRFDLRAGLLDAFVGRALPDAEDADAAVVVDGHGASQLTETLSGILNFFAGEHSPASISCLLTRSSHDRNTSVYMFLSPGAIHKDDVRLYGPSAMCLDPTADNAVLIAGDDKQKVIRRLTADQNVRT